MLNFRHVLTDYKILPVSQVGLVSEVKDEQIQIGPNSIWNEMVKWQSWDDPEETNVVESVIFNIMCAYLKI